MSTPQVPQLVGGSPIVVYYTGQLAVDCPSCRKPLDVTNVVIGAGMKCTDCGNITWRPENPPRWWHRLRNFIISNVISFVVGVLGSLVASWLWVHSH